MEKPHKSLGGLVNMQIMGLGVASSFALQESNTARIFQTMGVELASLPILMLAGPVTGLIMQPIIGHYSDRTWCRLGRRRPYFLGGAIVATLAMLVLPNAGSLWLAVAMLWVLDFALNAVMEPGRAFTSEMTPTSQRTFAFGLGMLIGGGGQVVGHMAPWVLEHLNVSNIAPAGVIPDTVRLSYYIGALFTILGVGWTVFAVREYSPAELAEFGDQEETEARPQEALVRPRGGERVVLAGLALTALILAFARDQYSLYVLGMGAVLAGLAQIANARGTRDNFIAHVFSDLAQMPPVMKQLAVVHFFTWIALFIRWPFTTPVITQYVFHSTDPTSAAYNEGANWVDLLNTTYSVVSALAAVLVFPWLARRFGNVRTHTAFLWLAVACYVSILFIRDKYLLFVPYVGFGLVWTSLNLLPFVILTKVLPANKLGIYLGIFNFFIVIPQILVSTTMGPILTTFFPGDPIWTFLIGAVATAFAALAMMRVGCIHKR
jgi:maltose/moltooligosaccharide transporter